MSLYNIILFSEKPTYFNSNGLAHTMYAYFDNNFENLYRVFIIYSKE